ncbi:MAG: hypothetical protein Q8811_02750, partial [Candidatus Phytoplasma australasiaticum]|nr:hypothetical protein [Candidatus Phytoplasma australasiaticum]
ARLERGFNKNERGNQGGGQRANTPFQGKGKQKVHDDQGVPLCSKCGKNHKGECLLGSNICYRFVKPYHKLRDCRVKGENLQVQGAPKGQVAPAANGGQAQRNNRFYVSQSKIGPRCDTSLVNPEGPSNKLSRESIIAFICYHNIIKETVKKKRKMFINFDIEVVFGLLICASFLKPKKD